MRRLGLGLAALVAVVVAGPPLWYAAFPEPAPELPPPGRRVEIAPGLGVNVIEAGAGPTVVLVHGHPGSGYDWSAVQAGLADRGFRAVAYDRVGYGRSDPRAADRTTVETNAEELLALLEALDVRDATLVGWSYGGATAIVAAKRDPSRLARLVLVGSVGPGIEARGTLPGPIAELLAGPVLSWVSSVPPLGRRLRAGFLALAFDPAPVPGSALRQFEANFARPGTLHAFRSEGRDLGGEADLDPAPIQRPVLVLHGDADRLVPPAVARAIAERAPRAQLLWVANAGHVLPVTHPDALTDAIADFANGEPAD